MSRTQVEPAWAIELQNVHCQAKDKELIHGITLQVKAGESLALLGPNGAGKTTLIRLICGLGPCSKGRIFLMGQPAGPKRNRAMKSLLGLVPQENDIERELTIRTSMLCYAELYGVARPRQVVAEILERFHMTEWADKKPDQISGGMHRRAMIARAALTRPQILILDEPSVGLDPELRQSIWQQIESLKEAGTTILLTTHYLEEAERLCDRAALIRSGQLLLIDSVTAIKKSVATLQGGSLAEISLEEAYLSLMQQEVAS